MNELIKYKRIHKDASGKILKISYWGYIDGDSANFTPMSVFPNESYDKSINLQCIGKKDKNGHYIYQGDMIHFKDAMSISDETGQQFEETLSLGVVCWDIEELMWDVVGRQTIERDTLLLEEIQYAEIVGNMFSTPEVLNQLSMGAGGF